MRERQYEFEEYGRIQRCLLEKIEEEMRVQLETFVENKVYESADDTVCICTDDTIWKEDIVLISREIGCGIIPIDRQERLWREMTGRLACDIAKRASQVYRLELGIAVRIK